MSGFFGAVVGAIRGESPVELEDCPSVLKLFPHSGPSSQAWGQTSPILQDFIPYLDRCPAFKKEDLGQYWKPGQGNRWPLGDRFYLAYSCSVIVCPKPGERKTTICLILFTWSFRWVFPSFLSSSWAKGRRWRRCRPRRRRPSKERKRSSSSR